MKSTSWTMCLLFASYLLLASRSAASGADLDVPMKRELVTVLIQFGLTDTRPSTWNGTYQLDRGRIVATDGWRFTGDDYATTEAFQCAVRRFYPRFWNRRGRDVNSLPMQPNGLQLTLTEVSRSSVLNVSTSQGNFMIPVGQLGYGPSRLALNGQVSYQRVPTTRQIVQASTEDAYPGAVAGNRGQLFVSYLAFTHGIGFQTRPPISVSLDDFAFLAKPTGGDRVMFMEMIDGSWSDPVALTDTGGEVLGTATALDGEDRVWVVWSANVSENWDLYAKVRTDGQWSETIRITSAPGSDFNHVLATDTDGQVWVAWQSFGESHSDILAATQAGDSFGQPMTVAAGPANDWTPAIAASRDGRVAVAWDTYEQGNYDVQARVWQSGRWGERQQITGSARNETRASLAYDSLNRLWIAYEESPEGWGKDFGPYDQSPKKTALYKERAVGIRVLKDGLLYTPEADIAAALPLPSGQPRHPRSKPSVLAASPKLCIDRSDRVWVSSRIRVTAFDSAVGGTWLTFLTSLDGERWRRAFVVPGTDGFLHETSALVPAPGSGLYLISCTDGRFRDAAFFGMNARQRRSRGADLPPPNTRSYATYPDELFNKEIAVADTGSIVQPAEEFKLTAVEPQSVAVPSPASQAEAQQVAAMRAYRADVNGRSLRIVRGEFHRHTEISSDGAGDGTLFDMWRYGLDMAALDWLGSGDHDNGNGREFSWWLTQKTTSLFSVPAAFTPMYTYERSCRYPDGHRNAVFATAGIRPLARLQGGAGKIMDDLPADASRPNTPDTQMFYKYLRYFDGICASHTSGTDMGTDWRDNDPKVEPIVEIYQGDRQNYERPDAPRSNSADYSIGGWRPLGFVSQALLKGYRLGFQSSSDHISTHMSYCNVWVEEPTREAILDGMKRRRVYGSTDNIIADVRCGEHFMGEEFETDELPTLDIQLTGTAPFEEVVIVKNNEYVYSLKPGKQNVQFSWTDHAAEPGKTSYYYVRGLQQGTTRTRKVKSPSGKAVETELNNGEIVWVSPMWITYKP